MRGNRTHTEDIGEDRFTERFDGGRRGSTIKYSEVEFVEISSSAFRNFLSKCKVWEEENGVRWNRNLIGEGVAGFLDLRYSKFKRLKGITGPSTGKN